MPGNPDAPTERTPDRTDTIKTSVLESLKNAEENGYGADLRAMTVDDIVLDLIWYSDMEDFTPEEIKPHAEEWLRNPPSPAA